MDQTGSVMLMFGFLMSGSAKASSSRKTAELYRESIGTYGALVTMRTMLDDDTV
jgi:hypothetical protein